MKKRLVDLRFGERPLLDIASYGRGGPGRSLTRDDVAFISRTTRGVPEVMIKISGGATSPRGVQAHVGYIGREGSCEIETDDGYILRAKGSENTIVKEWDLDLGANRRFTNRTVAKGRKPPKLVHNLVFSMPKGTPADKLKKAVQLFAREEFGLKHRYAMALHTDQGHPHVHVVVKAVDEQGKRLNIRKATLRDWRQQFATCLRYQGIEANATERAVRGEVRTPKIDGIYRAAKRGESTYWDKRIKETVRADHSGSQLQDSGRETLRETRRQVERGWYAVHDLLEHNGYDAEARHVRRFLSKMHPIQTDREQIIDGIGRQGERWRRDRERAI